MSAMSDSSLTPALHTPGSLSQSQRQPSGWRQQRVPSPLTMTRHWLMPIESTLQVWQLSAATPRQATWRPFSQPR